LQTSTSGFTSSSSTAESKHKERAGFPARFCLVVFAWYEKNGARRCAAPRQTGGNRMKEIAQADGLLIREMEAVPADFEQVLRWMTDPETMRFWEGMTEIYDL